MGQRKKIDTPLPGRVSDYLRGFRAESATAGDASLEEYLLERAARDLKAARHRVDSGGRRPAREQGQGV